jgi:hypothetical protein
VGNKTYDGGVIQPWDLLPPGGSRLDGLTFVRCFFRGPAVMLLAGCALRDNRFMDTLSEIIWEIPRTREVVTGTIAFTNCTFERCTFEAIGLAAWEGSDTLKVLRSMDEV